MHAVLKPFALLIFLCAALFSTGGLAQMLDCGPLVSIVNGAIQVEPAPDDDTEEIQCALDSAGPLGIPTVRLTDGVFAISQVMVEDFNGSLEGRSKADTLLIIFDESLDCQAQEDAGRFPAAIKFVNGNARVARMTISSGGHCIGDTNRENISIHFTGSPADSGCDNETGFGQVDRVDMVNETFFGGGSANIAIAAAAEGAFLNSCRDTQLGTFKLNRSLLEGYNAGVFLSLRGAGQVDINFSDLIDNAFGIVSSNANQLLTVQSNDFMVSSENIENSVGIFSVNFEGGPSQNRVVVFNNRFSFEGGGLSGIAFNALGAPSVSKSVAFTANRFNATGVTDLTVMALSDINNASISGNRASGSTFSGIDFFRSNSNVISGNTLDGLNATAGDTVFFAETTQGNIVGPGQGAIVADLGDNIVLNPQAALAKDSVVKSDSLESLAGERAAMKQRISEIRARIAQAKVQKGITKIAQ